jgi:hypothetical protein
MVRVLHLAQQHERLLPLVLGVPQQKARQEHTMRQLQGGPPHQWALLLAVLVLQRPWVMLMTAAAVVRRPSQSICGPGLSLQLLRQLSSRPRSSSGRSRVLLLTSCSYPLLTSSSSLGSSSYKLVQRHLATTLTAPAEAQPLMVVWQCLRQQLWLQGWSSCRQWLPAKLMQ